MTVDGKMDAITTQGWLVCISLLIAGGLVYTLWSTPDQHPTPIVISGFDRGLATGLFGLAYVLTLLRLPFAVLPYAAKVFVALVFKKRYDVSHYDERYEVLRIAGDVANWVVGSIVFTHLAEPYSLFSGLMHASIVAEGVRLVAEKGSMVFSAGWQCLPHRRMAHFVTQLVTLHLKRLLPRSPITRVLSRYVDYYVLSDDQRMSFILDAVRGYAACDAGASQKLAYVTALRIKPNQQGIRGGSVRDVARGEIYIHRQWLADPDLVIGQILRRSPWFFDPRYLARPFYYRSQSNRLATWFVLAHARYCPRFAFYQFGHEIKVARYDCFYRVLRLLGIDIEPKVLADGTFQFDHILKWLEARLYRQPPVAPPLLWTTADALNDVQRRTAQGEVLSPMDIAVSYTFPLKFVQEVLLTEIAK